ncbi:hypothetical protein FKV24_007920 [Lysobacter maris]|uniref:Uncharacterized protein n=1 Tax=Marilutibacter maris TaxID=1605891 RepID=A0A508AU95_9GAMM|nr:hypothetical protein [Lysobacter maris]KAB8191374.1 hypothetical protein FKV24_007920 [Lysobacter maris]
MRASLLFALVSTALLVACSMKVVRVDMDPARLAVSSSPEETAGLACDYRLGEVVDARPAGARSGGLGPHAFSFVDAADTVRSQLVQAGLSETETASPPVSVRIAQLYLAQNLGTKVPVAVYQVSVADEPAFVVRSQAMSMNWNGSQDEAYRAYAQVLADVNQRLLQQLNARCVR